MKATCETPTGVSSVQTAGQRDQWAPAHVYVGMPCKASRAFGISDTEGAFGKPWEFAHQPNWAELYSDHMARRLLTDPAFAAKVRDLHGKVLLCWCTAKAAHRGTEVQCHARILAEYVELLFHARR